MDCPILVWMLSYNRPLTQEEYDKCYRTLQVCVPHVPLEYAPQNQESVRVMVAHMLPLLMMRHRRIPRAKWRDCSNSNGKRWIEQDSESAMNPTHRLKAMIGYHLAWENNLIGMVMTQGRQREVVNLGLGMKQLCTDAPGVSISDWAESQHHKLTPLEITFITPPEKDDVVLRRLCLILALKQAYIKAIGQPIGFDWSRLEFNIPGENARGDGYPLQGWEFRLWQSQIAVMREDGEVEEHHYQCASAFFRGTAESKFIWQKDKKELESWVQFLNIDQLITVLPKLMD
ncbi:hypothetical protein PHLGIDRAFT_72337 [Phlebiopsis gigantea 11061_1 CR5-6]|uniref:4'-phosphopantetheinyl transferase domain-containing protein n=1 Tax=Phlebiopsis gigantea (strain 11061_1 CR5-6) TaxID=745531 RepID=A0A0C3PK67_PHLG1|nr:hypothetical protein PHLGIDRAFT_72337 [Phlebiopsis gigantea 11061_1 CR5-6]